MASYKGKRKYGRPKRRREFTRKERRWISRKIAWLRKNEGRKASQASAIAYSMARKRAKAKRRRAYRRSKR